MFSAAVAAVDAAGASAVARRRRRYLRRSLYWRLRAGFRRLRWGSSGWRRQRFTCHYDAFSYAPNFDDGPADFVR